MCLSSLLLALMVPVFFWILVLRLYAGQGLSLVQDYMLPWFFLLLPLEMVLVLKPLEAWCLPALPLVFSYPLVWLWSRHRGWEKIQGPRAFHWSHPLLPLDLHRAWVYPGLWLLFLLWLRFPRWNATLDLAEWWQGGSPLLLEYGPFFLFFLPHLFCLGLLALGSFLRLRDHCWQASLRILLGLHIQALSSPVYGIPARRVFRFCSLLVTYLTAMEVPREERARMNVWRKLARALHYRRLWYLLPLLGFFLLECYVRGGEIHHSFRLLLLLSLWYLLLSLLRGIALLSWKEHSVVSDLYYQEDAWLHRYPLDSLLFLEDHEDWPQDFSQTFLDTLLHRAYYYPLRGCSEISHRTQVERRVRKRGEAWVREAYFRSYQGNRRWMHTSVAAPALGRVPGLYHGLCSSLDQNWCGASVLLGDSMHHTMALRRTLQLPPQGLELREIYGKAWPTNGLFPRGTLKTLEQLQTANQVIQLAWLAPHCKVSPWREEVFLHSPGLSNLQPDVIVTVPRSSGDYSLGLDFKLGRGMINNVLGGPRLTESRLIQYEGSFKARLTECSPEEYLDLERALNHARFSRFLLSQRDPLYWKHWAQGLDYLKQMPPVYLPQMDTHLLEDQALVHLAQDTLRAQSLRLQEKFPQAPCQDIVCPHARQEFGQEPLPVKRPPRGGGLDLGHEGGYYLLDRKGSRLGEEIFPRALPWGYLWGYPGLRKET
jgi:hypothetical protein